MTIKEYQKAVDSWINTIGVRYFSELTNMAILSEEVGELASIIARKYGDQSFKETISEQKIKESLQDEIADVLWVLTCIANQVGVDLEKAILKNLDKKNKRDKDRHKNNEKLLS